ncbi:hypothetical protein EV664_107166 [Stakelama pacifica]|uniref:Uncharacterized protein n=1 Tax=Stakelama pacifica TaxID=517720 RepID=A0A4R6FM87_9SPHN|nr:hypothetical protein EV664_107166 [Stakelama pacifica]GGO96502.1 hypothetical protein GCM10011329_23180 [Stakelama pacifica]
MLHDLALVGLGALIAATFIHKREPAPTSAHLFGEEVGSLAQQTLQRASFAGSEYRATSCATFTVNGHEVEIAMAAYGEDGPDCEQHHSNKGRA